ncbi:MAG: InlB B-repeat-containing protein [Oscillospiraceae bacterium]|nr:InlB B-repeat-containing protein [Oscillospiraceae bacterium]
MKKRWICGLLAAVLALSLVPAVPIETEAAEENISASSTTMTVSDELIEVLKTMEGFNKRAEWDYAQYTVGYGTRCPDDMLDYYRNNDITVAEAEALLHNELAYFERSVNNLIAKYNLNLAQHQYDALVCFSYNVGAGWMRSSGGYLLNSVVYGGTNAEFIYGITLWSKAGGDYILQKRRLSEANMYLNGVYKAYNTSGGVPSNYRYVFLDGNGGTVRYAIHGFDANGPVPAITYFTDIPTGVDADGNPFVYEFAGWFTERTGGREVAALDNSLASGSVIYAQWKNPQGEIVELPVGDPIDPLEITVTAGSALIRSGPGSYYTEMKKLTTGNTVTITEVYTVSSVTWGKCEQGWLNLANTNYTEVLAGLPKEFPQWGTVNGGQVRIRTGPGVSYSIITEVDRGARVEISEEHYDGTYNWGKIVPGTYDWGTADDSTWICVDYVVYDTPEEVTLSSVSMLKLPTNLEYVQMQDVLDLTGSVLVATYSDGSIKAMTVNDSMTSGYSHAKLGTNTVKVTYSGKSTTFDVTIVKATVTFQNYDGSVLSSAQYAYGDTVIQPETPTKPADENGVYRFVGWDKTVTTCKGDAVYTAVFKPEYTVTFQNYDGTVLSSIKYVLGDTVAEPEAPTKPADEYGTYRFAGWDKTVTVCSGDAVYTAVFKPEYTVTFKNYDGTVLSSIKYVLGDTVAEPEAPTKPADANGAYRFAGWDKTVTVCKGEEVYTAVFQPIYTVTFRNYDGTVLSSNEYVLGDAVTEPETPTRPEDAYGTYEFIGWDKEVTVCNGDAVYTAVFRRIPGEGSSEFLTGDFDMNGEINEDDATYLLGYILFPDWYPVDGIVDLNSDGTVNEDDATYLLGYILFPDWYPLPVSDG